MYRLVYLSGPYKGKRLVVQQGSVVVGRDPDCHIIVPDDEVSRKHVVIEQRPEGIHIRDLGSMNGIVVNNQPLREALLRHNDVIELGRTRLQYQETAQSEVTEARRVSHVQGLTFAAIVLIILFELTFLVGLSVWHEDVLSVSPPPEPAGAPPAAAETAAVAQTEAPAPPPPEPAPAPVQPVASPVAPVEAEARVSNEIQQLRADVEGLREQVQELAQPPPVPIAIEPVEAEPAAAPAVEPLTAKAQQMLDEAMLEAARHNLVQADRQLERIQIMAPDFLPAYVERARLLESRGLLAKAGEQWTEVMKRSMGTPLYQQAAAERTRLARQELVQKTAAGPSSAVASADTASRLPRRLRIVSVDEQRFQESEQFEEMRLVGVTLKPKPGERDLDPSEVRVVIRFFDEDRESKEVGLTRAVAPKEALRMDGYWSPGDQRSVSAAYVVPRGFRDQETAKYNQQWRFYGYVVQVYYREDLQDEDARPKTLLEKAASLPPPWRTSKPARARSRPEPAPAPTNAPPAETVTKPFTMPFEVKGDL
ncbi:MAG: FHA domain-containing protein [Verrucomicrobiota bacterium]